MALSKEEYMKHMVEKYADMVYRLALARTRKKEDGEDVFQEVFLKLSQKMPEFENEEHEKAWLIKVTINCSKNLFASAWNRYTIPLEEDIEFVDKEAGEVYYEVLRLPLKYRTVIHLFYYERMTIEEISKILKMNSNTVKTQLARSRQQLKQKLEGGF